MARALHPAAWQALSSRSGSFVPFSSRPRRFRVVIPRVQLAATLEWPNAARLAIAFRDAGFGVEVVALAGLPVHAMTARGALSYIGRVAPPLRSDRRSKSRSHNSSFLATTVL
jgi:hypothetical protein